VLNCTFRRNWSENHGGVNDHGAASCFVDCTWRDNYSAFIAAGLYVHHHSMAMVIHGQFIDNEAALDGGGTYVRSEHGATFVDSVWIGNRAVSGAGMFHSENSAAHVTGCEFRENQAQLGGAGIFTERTHTIVENCLFEQNGAGLEIISGGGGGGGSGGAGFWSTGGDPIVSNCVFRDNIASFGAGVYHIEDSAAVVVDCDFYDNQAGEGGGLYTLASPSYAARCRFVGNEAFGTSFSVGGGMEQLLLELGRRGLSLPRQPRGGRRRRDVLRGRGSALQRSRVRGQRSVRFRSRLGAAVCSTDSTRTRRS
jgi:hypothetical protein